ncbi:hypothetical protein AWH48_11985 [Domibacillus aminovorans]|uniref:DUF2612 domain-containing protein n=1 Tax=Domibacillus aminovorans TaxID=29332 RepID=A0A177KKG4_9BACI|nr:hypothetical protein [Domibacillus aminovorans]OAH53071.1 hypothetical protein AWH48_11985 [Domibacillus aminovorans]
MLKLFTLDTILYRLTDRYKKNKNSNIGKMMQIFSDELELLQETNIRIEEWREIDNAEGVALDEIGEDLKQPRGIAADEVYRVLLKAKSAGNQSNGDINSLIRVISIALNVRPYEVKIYELWDDTPEHYFISPHQFSTVEHNDTKPAAIKINSFPIERLNETALSPNHFYKLVRSSMSAGVELEELVLEGTFEFGDVDMEEDETKGFSDIEGEIGGYLGIAFSSDNEIDLPI